MKRHVFGCVIFFLILGIFIGWMLSPRTTDISQFESYRVPEIFGKLDPRKVNAGFEEMKNSRVVITGLIRDGESRIPNIKRNIAALTQHFAQYAVLIVENDSKDQTRPLLLEWTQEDPNIKVLGCGVNAGSCALNLPRTEGHSMQRNRIVKMAYLRNLYLDYVLRNYPYFDYLIVIDLDLFGYPYADGIADSFYYLSTNRKINGIAANGLLMSDEGRFFYYDPFAYRPLGRKLDFDTEDEKNKWDKEVFANAYPKVGSGIMQVLSAFAGLAIYRIPDILLNNARYFPPEIGKYGCEHVHFHKSLPGIYINPNMIYAIFDNSPL